MIKDIYIRPPSDPNYKFLYEHSNPIESIIAKIKMILNTRQGGVLGDLNFGVGIEDLIFATRINSKDIEEKIRKQIYQYISEANEYSIAPKISFGKGAGYDFAIIDILVNGNKVAGIIVS